MPNDKELSKPTILDAILAVKNKSFTQFCSKFSLDPSHIRKILLNVGYIVCIPPKKSVSAYYSPPVTVKDWQNFTKEQINEIFSELGHLRLQFYQISPLDIPIEWLSKVIGNKNISEIRVAHYLGWADTRSRKFQDAYETAQSLVKAASTIDLPEELLATLNDFSSPDFQQLRGLLEGAIAISEWNEIQPEEGEDNYPTRKKPALQAASPPEWARALVTPPPNQRYHHFKQPDNRGALETSKTPCNKIALNI